MSYDVDIGKEEFNHTSNTYLFFAEILPGNDQTPEGINGLNSMTGAEAAGYIALGLERARSMFLDMKEEEIREKYDSKNGWGTVYTSILFLSRIMHACNENPFSKVSVC